MKYLEDTLAEQCLSKTLYPNTKIIVRRKKVDGAILTYTNELEVEVDFSDVDPNLFENFLNKDNGFEFDAHLNNSPKNTELNTSDSGLPQDSADLTKLENLVRQTTSFS